MRELEEVGQDPRPSRVVAAWACKSCRKPIREEHFYCYPCWGDLIGRLGDKVERVSYDAAEIYIGRTCDPGARREEHYEDSRRGNLTVLHWSDNIDEVCAVEEALIREFAFLRKLANATDVSFGGGRTDLRNCVYVSWRRKLRW
jgi:hypothetical protein